MDNLERNFDSRLIPPYKGELVNLLVSGERSARNLYERRTILHLYNYLRARCVTSSCWQPARFRLLTDLWANLITNEFVASCDAHGRAASILVGGPATGPGGHECDQKDGDICL